QAVLVLVVAAAALGRPPLLEVDAHGADDVAVVHGIVAGAAVDRVVAEPRPEVVRLRIADQQVVEVGAAHGFDGDQRVGTVGAGYHAGGQVHGDAAGGGLVIGVVEPSAAVEGVVAAV